MRDACAFRVSGSLLPAAALLLLLAAAPASAESTPRPLLPELRLSRLISTLDEFGEEVEEPEKTIEDFITGDPEAMSAFEERGIRKKEMKEAQERTYQAIDRYANKKLTNMRFGFSLFSTIHREMKRGKAGWGYYEDLFESGTVLMKVHAGETEVFIPTGGVEISFIGTPFYHILMGISYDAFAGRKRYGQEFSDFFYTSYYLGLRFNILNEYIATQKFEEMLDYENPVHITGLNVYLKFTMGLHIFNRVLMRGSLNGTDDDIDTYFNQTESLGYSLLAGCEYRVSTLGFFLEAGWSFIRHPHSADGLTNINHFRSFPVLAGITVYFGA